jgi:hypothetical protein
MTTASHTRGVVIIEIFIFAQQQCCIGALAVQLDLLALLVFAF